MFVLTVVSDGRSSVVLEQNASRRPPFTVSSRLGAVTVAVMPTSCINPHVSMFGKLIAVKLGLLK